jgi:hypothetical protein
LCAEITGLEAICATIAPLENPTMRDLIGRTLGHYRIVDKIGEGGTGGTLRI